MKSKIFYFNKTIFKKNMTHFWPLWLAYAVYMMLILPVNIWQKMSGTYVEDIYDIASRKMYNISRVLGSALEPSGVFFFAVIAVMAVFSYLYSAKNANMIHALPVNRKELFATNFLSGFVFMVIPELMAFVAAVFVCLGYQITSIEYLFVWLLYMVGMTFFALAIATLVAMLTGQLLAVPIYFYIANYLFVGCLYIVSSLIQTICYGISEAWRPGKECILSPIYYLNNNLRCKKIFDETGDKIIGIEIAGGRLILIYSIVAIVIIVLAYQLYRKRQIETAGDLISVSYIKPVYRWGVALCAGFLIPVAVIEMMLEDHLVKYADAILLVGVILTGLIGFFGAEMLMQKNFRVFCKKRILEGAAMVVVTVAILGVFKLDVFGVERKVPEEADVGSCYICLDYPIYLEKEQIADIIELHKQLLAEEESVLEYISNGGKTCSVDIRYTLKDNTTLARRYYVPVNDDYLSDENSAISKVLAVEFDKENLLRYAFGNYYETNEYYSGHIELYDVAGNYTTYRFNDEELQLITDAIVADIEAGNYGVYQSYSIDDSMLVEQEEYFNTISLAYYNEKGISFDVDEYYNYDNGSYETVVMSDSYGSKSSTSYICFGEKCENIVNTLKELGIINEEWKLYTYEEYQEITNR